MKTHRDFVEDEEGQCHILKVWLVHRGNRINSTTVS